MTTLEHCGPDVCGCLGALPLNVSVLLYVGAPLLLRLLVILDAITAARFTSSAVQLWQLLLLLHSSIYSLQQ